MTTSTDTSTSTSAGNTGAATTDTGTGSDTDLTAEVDKWKALARKHEKNWQTATAELTQIKTSTQTDAEQAAEKARQADERIAEVERRVLRRDIALEHKLTSDDAKLLDAITDEDAMRALAGRLAGDAAAAASRKNGSNVVRREGKTTTGNGAGADPVRELTRQLFQRGDD